MKNFLVWIILYGLLVWKFKNPIVEFVRRRFKLPVLLNYLILTTPIIIVEEWFTCEIPYNSCIKITLPAFWLLFLISYLVQKIFKLHWLRASIVFAVIGLINEMIVVGRINVYDPGTALVASVISLVVYGLMAVIPASYLASNLIIKKGYVK